MNKIFKSKTGAKNNAGGDAYRLSAKQSLATYCSAGCFGDTFYTTGENQVEELMSICKSVDAEFIGKTAIFVSENAFMKDTPAFLVAYLLATNLDVFEKVFSRVIRNGRMLRGFCQIVRSGVCGRRSFGSCGKRHIKDFIQNRRPEALFFDSVGKNPSLVDIIKMVHPKPGSEEQAHLFKYILGHEDYSLDNLPKVIQDFELFKSGKSNRLPNVDQRFLTFKKLSQEQWIEIAINSNWTTTRMNIDAWEKHGVYKDKRTVEIIANKLRSPELVRQSRCFPYQLFTAYNEISKNSAIPREIKEALQDAMEVATENVPEIDGNVFVFPDVSGSMSHPVTGKRSGQTTLTRCIDIAGLISACVLRKNPSAEVIPFNGKAIEIELNPRDSVITNANKLAAIGGLSTYCPAPLKFIMSQNKRIDVVIFVSDNESWVNGSGGFGKRIEKGTELAQLWSEAKVKNPNAKMICIDCTPGTTVQALDDESILNIGGFSDQVFSAISSFLSGNANNWIDKIDEIIL